MKLTSTRKYDKIVLFRRSWINVKKIIFFNVYLILANSTVAVQRVCSTD